MTGIYRFSQDSSVQCAHLIIHVTAGEERTASVSELGEDAASAPHIYAGSVELGSEQDIRRSVPEGHHLGAVASHWNTEGPSKTKICQFELPVFVDE